MGTQVSALAAVRENRRVDLDESAPVASPQTLAELAVALGELHRSLPGAEEIGPEGEDVAGILEIKGGHCFLTQHVSHHLVVGGVLHWLEGHVPRPVGIGEAANEVCKASAQRSGYCQDAAAVRLGR